MMACGHYLQWLLLATLLVIVHLTERVSAKGPKGSDQNKAFCNVPVNQMESCQASSSSECQEIGCCWKRKNRGGTCYKGKAQYPKTCQDSYANGNTESGVHELETSKGEIFEVYCLFVSGKSGFVFPGRNAIEKVKYSDLKLKQMATDKSEILVLQRHTDGTTFQAFVKPMKQYSKYGLSFFQNKWGSFADPYRRNIFGDKFIYVGFLDKNNYKKKKAYTLGINSNGKDITYGDCDQNPNNYMVFYSNMKNKTFCESGWDMGRKFLNNFKSTDYGKVMDHDEFWFTLEMHFGGCGMRYSSACSGIRGYAVGLPFGMPSGTCKSSGLPHIRSFDGKKLGLFGACQYVAVQDGCEEGTYQDEATFRVIVDLEKKKKRTSVIKAINIDTGFGKISLGVNMKVLINGISMRNFPVGGLGGATISKSRNLVVIRLRDGIEVVWTGTKFAVNVPYSYRSKLCGLCGNFNGDTDDDWIMGVGKMCPASSIQEGQISTKFNQFITSWITAMDSDENCDSECDTADEEIDDEECSSDAKKSAKKHCEKLFKSKSKFKKCLDELSKSEYEDLVEECESEACIIEDPDDELLCEQAQNLAELCRSEYGVAVNGWREKNFCDVTCPDKMEYNDCGTQYQATCLNQNGFEGGPCQEGCFCKTGYVSNGDECVQPKECGCVWDGVLYKVGEEVMSPDCSQVCKCTEQQPEMICKKSECAVNSICTVQDEQRLCICPPNHKGNGKKCKAKMAKCRVSGDPHIKTFDRKKYNFMGSCQYVVAQDSCKNGIPDSNPSFKVVGDFFRKKPVDRVSWTKAVYIYLPTPSSHKISLLDSGEVKLNKVRLNHFPAHLETGVTIKKQQDKVIIILHNGVTIMWIARRRRVFVKVPEVLEGQMCGLCGNFNSDPDDDSVMGPQNCNNRKGMVMGQTATTNSQLGVSWLYLRDTDFGCKDECEHIYDPEPECPLADKQAAKDHCADLYDLNGRFAECLLAMDPSDLADVVDDCEFDTCLAGDPYDELFCSEAEALVEMCRETYRVNIEGWRNGNFCPMTCPPNMVYKDCGTSCPPTCDDPNGSHLCVEQCMEGCFCEEGFVADGDNCIKPHECGCSNNGILYMPGESFLNDNCSLKCVCPGPGADIECEPSQCHEHSVCAIVDDERACVCERPFVGNGTFCKFAPKDEKDKEAYPCNAAPPTCTVASRSDCVALRIAQVCGIGMMTEVRHCYNNTNQTGSFIRKTIKRDCCIKPCGGGSAPPGEDGLGEEVGPFPPETPPSSTETPASPAPPAPPVPTPPEDSEEAPPSPPNPGYGYWGVDENGNPKLYLLCKDVYPICEE